MATQDEREKKTMLDDLPLGEKQRKAKAAAARSVKNMEADLADPDNARSMKILGRDTDKTSAEIQTRGSAEELIAEKTHDIIEKTTKAEGKPELADTFKEFAPFLIATAVGGLDAGFAAQTGAIQAQAAMEEGDLQRRKTEAEIAKLEREASGAANMKLRFREDTLDPATGKPVFTSEDGRVFTQEGKEITSAISGAQERFKVSEERRGKSLSLNQQKEQRKIYQDFDKDKVVSGIRDRRMQVTNAEGMLQEARDNPIAAATLPRLLSRLSGEKGVLTDRDVDDFRGSQAIIARLNQIAKTMADGTVTDENLDYMNRLVSRMSKNTDVNFQKEAERYATKLSKVVGGDKAEHLDILMSGETVAAPAATSRQGISLEDKKSQLKAVQAAKARKLEQGID